MDKYSMVIQWSEEDGGYIATVPELPGLSAFGTTQKEAAKEISIAKEAYIEVFAEDDCDLPEPDLLISFSGQIRLRLPKSLHSSLSREAKYEGVSLNTYIISLLSEKSISRRLDKKIDDLGTGVENLKNQTYALHLTNQASEQAKSGSTTNVIHKFEETDLSEGKSLH